MFKEISALYMERSNKLTDDECRAKELNKNIRETLADANFYLLTLADCMNIVQDAEAKKRFQADYDYLYSEICSANYRFKMGGTLEAHEAKLEKLKDALYRVKH